MQYSIAIITAFLAIGGFAAPIETSKRDGGSIQVYCPAGRPKDVAGEVTARAEGCIPKRTGDSIQVYCPAGHFKDVAGEVNKRATGCITKRELVEEIEARAESIAAYGPGHIPNFLAGEVEDRDITV